LTLAFALAREFDLRARFALVARLARFVEVGIVTVDDFGFGGEHLAVIGEHFRLVRVGVRLIAAVFGIRGFGCARRSLGARALPGHSLGGLRFSAFLCVCFGCHGVLEAALGRVRAT